MYTLCGREDKNVRFSGSSDEPGSLAVPTGESGGGAWGCTIDKIIQLVVQGTPTVLSTSFTYFSSLNNPAVFFFRNFAQTENGIDFPAILIFKFVDSSGSPIPNATVSAGGWPLYSLGSGYYAVVVPTSVLSPSAYPIMVSANADLYESQKSFFLLQVNERSVLIPFVNIRVPLTTFLIIIFSVAIPISAFSVYSYAKMARIPAIIRRIDQLIAMISRGEKVDAKVIPRESVISRVLAGEMATVGVEPRVEAYVSIELINRLVPLLVESGMKEQEAYALAIELKTATPVEREKLLESVGVSGESSTRIMQIIEEEEEKATTFLKPQVRPPEPEPVEESEEHESSEKKEEEETKTTGEEKESEEGEDKSSDASDD